MVERAEEADLVLIAGSEADRLSYHALWRTMEIAAKRGVPAICTNPDRVMMAGGRLHPGAGTFAQAYREAGGSIRFFGKPYAELYRAAFELIPGVARSRVVGVGDSLEHNIAGATALGCRTLLIRDGILADLALVQLNDEMRRVEHKPDIIGSHFAQDERAFTKSFRPNQYKAFVSRDLIRSNAMLERTCGRK